MLRFKTLQISTTLKIAVAFGTVVVVIAGASFVAYKSYSKSRDLTAVARQDRQDALTAERAIGAFWKQRESIGEYLLAPDRAGSDEAQRMQDAFEALATVAPGTSVESKREAAYFAQAVRANAILVSSVEATPAGRPTRKVIRMLHAAEQDVLGPLQTVSDLNKAQYLDREAVARSAGRDALHVALASAALALAAIGWFAFFATRLVRRVDRQNASLREGDALKDEFINTISHELRTPITSIQGYLELLLDEEADGADPLSNEQRTFLQTIDRSSGRLMHLVNDLLLLAQARAGRLQMNKSSCDLVELARQAVEGALATAAKNGLTLSLHASVNQAHATADAARLGQAFDNLVSNAIKFTPRGGKVTVGISSVDGNSVITVADTGMGMQPAEVDRLFEQFFRTEAAQAAQIQGTGLGLAITKTIVDAHSGTITIASQPGSGTTFTISLPLESNDGTTTRSDRMAPDGRTGRSPQVVVPTTLA